MINGISLSVKNKDRIKEENGKYLFKCSICGKYLPLSEFELRWNSDKTKKNNIRSQCKKCRTEESRKYHYFRRRKYTEKFAKERMLHLDRLKHDLNYHNQMVMWTHAKQHAKMLNCEFTIKPTDIMIPKKCPLLDHEFILHDPIYTYSIDRIDNTKGYTPDNIAVISRLANTMKNKATIEQLEIFAKNIKSYIKK